MKKFQKSYKIHKMYATIEYIEWLNEYALSMNIKGKKRTAYESKNKKELIEIVKLMGGVEIEQ